MKQTLESIISRLNKVQAVLEHTSVQTTADESLTRLLTFIETEGFDSALGARLTGLLQLSDDQTRIATYQLKDIGHLFDALLRANPDNVDLFIEAAFFFDLILEDSQKGKTLAMDAQKLLEKKQRELSDLLASLEQ